MPLTRAEADLGLWKRVTAPLTAAKFTIDGGAGVKSISIIDVDSPSTLTAVGHNFVTGNVLTVLGVRGAVELNGPWPITVLDANAFILEGSVGVNPWTGGGFVVRSPIADFDTAFAKALAFMKVAMVDVLSPSDADMANLSQSQVIELLDIAEYEIYNEVSSTAGAGAGYATDQRWPDYSYRIDPQAVLFLTSQVKGRGEFVLRTYGYGAAKLRLGSVNIGLRDNVSSGGEFS